jgi:predicted nucleic-acid-binding Zn-ribbon protein
MVDDLFLFHDVIFREYLGISELIVYPLYMAGTALFLYHFRERIGNSDYIILMLSIGFFVMSIFADIISDKVFSSQGMPGGYLFEDGFKFLGIASWLVYFSRTAFLDIMGVVRKRKARMSDGVCPRCDSSSVRIVKSQAPVDVPGVPLAAVYRYEKAAVTPLHNDQYSMVCDDCGYSEFFLSEKTKLVSVAENTRKTG